MSIDIKASCRIDSQKNASSGSDERETDGAAIRDVCRKLKHPESENARLKKTGVRITAFIARP